MSFAQYLTRALQEIPSPGFFATPEVLKDHINPILSYLNKSRPTAVNLGNAIKRLNKTLKDSTEAGADARLIAQDLIKEAKKVAEEDVGRNKEMSKWGGNWLIERVKLQGKSEDQPKLNVLTVCNTGSLATSVRAYFALNSSVRGLTRLVFFFLQGYGTALGLITYLHEIGKLGKAYYTQTAPYHQGSRLTALELQMLEIPSMMVCDTMVGSLFQHYPIQAVGT